MHCRDDFVCLYSRVIMHLFNQLFYAFFTLNNFSVRTISLTLWIVPTFLLAYTQSGAVLCCHSIIELVHVEQKLPHKVRQRHKHFIEFS